MQIINSLKPVSVNTNTSKRDLKDSEATFLKNYELNYSKAGGDLGVGKKVPSNYQLVTLPLPTGINKTLGYFENKELNECYVFRYNSNALHNIYRIDGLTLTADLVYQGSYLGFSLDGNAFIPKHRVFIRVVYDVTADGSKKVKEKYLGFTNGIVWQKWIPVLAAIATQGFMASQYPYYNLRTPHFDAAELIDYPVRPPMYAPVIVPVMPQPADLNKPNFLLDKSIQFAYRYIMTDRRPSALSWYSEPYFTGAPNCNSNNGDEPRNVDLTLYVGSAHVEQIQLLTRLCNGDWQLYDTIDRFDTLGSNNPKTIGDSYWNRTNQWAAYNYNFRTNTLVYRYSGDRGTAIFSPSDGVDMVQNDVPLLSQSITQANNALIWGDNLYNYPNIPDTELNKFSLAVVDEGAGSCVVHYVKMTLYAIMSHDARVNAVVFKNGPMDTQRYMGTDLAVSQFYQMNLNSRDGLLCYLAGTNYSSVGQQYILESDGTLTFLGILDYSLQSQKDLYVAIINRGALIVQQFTFEVPKGNYIARLARHNADGNSDFEKTSSYVMGMVNRSNMAGAQGGIANFNDIQTSSFATVDKEFRIDATAGDYNSLGKSSEMFFVYTPDFFQNDPNQSFRFIEGYVQENITNKIGVEFIYYSVPLGNNYNKRTGFYTDYNGFFFGFGGGADAYKTEIDFQGNQDCTPRSLVFTTTINKYATIDRGYYPAQNISVSDKFGGSVGFGNYVLVKGKVENCDTGVGISGVGITMTGGQTFYTDSNGNFVLHYHIFIPGIRHENLYINTSGKCVFTSCNCLPMPIVLIDGSTIGCNTVVEQVYPVNFILQLKASTQSGTGVKGGGKYGVAIFGHDLAGRKTFAGVIGYVDIPTFLEKGTFVASRIQWTKTAVLNLAPEIKWLTFGITKNLLFIKYLQWVGDKIDFLDGFGNIAADGNGAVRAKVTIQSLLAFNNLYNFATTVTYQFVPGDRIRIYDDGNGNLFPPAANNGFLEYRVLGTDFGSSTTDGKSFIIEYDTRLLALKSKCGFWIELFRPQDTTSKDAFFGVTGTYPVIGGDIAINTVVLNAFDTYLQQRVITIPSCGSSTFNHPFESNSVTDFWGQGCDSSGAALFRDKLAEQRWYPNDIIRSDEFLNEGRLNGLGICRTQNRKDFGDQDFGGIVFMNTERNIITIICQNDWFMVDYDQNFARVDSTGRIYANTDTNVGSPNQKSGEVFGCEFEDTATIIADNGRIYFADRKRSAIVMIEGRHAYDLAMIDNKNYFIEKFKSMIRFNATLTIGTQKNLFTIDVISGINPFNSCYYITFRYRLALDPSPVNFVNNEREVMIGISETFVYSPQLKKWVQFTGFTPEFYGSLEKAASGDEMITFAGGQSWFHNSDTTVGFNKFYGIRTDQVITVVANENSSKLKVFQRIAVESPDVKYFVPKIATDDPGLFSYVPLSYFIKRGNVFYSMLLRNMNTYPDVNRPVTSMLVDGKSITGNYAEFTLVADTNRQEDAAEIDHILVGLIGSEKSDR
jgi:hypothetical protein